MFGISGEHLLVLLVILLIFGPKRLPDLGHSIGRTMKNFKDAMNGNSEPAAPPVAAAPAKPSQIEASNNETAKTADTSAAEKHSV